jgi:hypothetical protein
MAKMNGDPKPRSSFPDWICRTVIKKTRDARTLFLLPGEKVRMRASQNTIFTVPVRAKSPCQTLALPMNRPNRREVLECGGWRGTGLTPLWLVWSRPKPKRCVPSPLTHRTPRRCRARVTGSWFQCAIMKSLKLPMNLTFGARRLRRFNVRCPKAFERGSGVNAALRFRGSMPEWFWEILTPALSPRETENYLQPRSIPLARRDEFHESPTSLATFERMGTRGIRPSEVL